MTRQQAEKKVQVAIDKMIDLHDNSDNWIQSKAQRILDALRELENEIMSSKSKNGTITHQP